MLKIYLRNYKSYSTWKRAIHLKMGDDYFEKSIHLNTIYASANLKKVLTLNKFRSIWKSYLRLVKHNKRF